MMITRAHLHRRTFLRGIGATLALPLLDSMVPALAAPAAGTAPKRLAIAYVPNGIIMDKWTPAATGAGFEFSPTLEPLKPFRDNVLVISGLESKPAFPAPGEGTGDHVRAASTFLTGVHPKKTEGPDIRAGVSMDQIAARELGKETQLASLELCLDPNELIGACEAGYSCAYSNTLSWRNETTPLPMENQPRAVFERLFGDSDNTTREARLARIQEDRSILDSLVQEVSGFNRRLGPADKAKLAQYLDAIRDLERRIQKAEAQAARELPPMDRPTGGIPATFAEHARMMFDLQVLAYQTDMTRIVTFLMSREVSPRPYPEIGVPDAHHGLSHHQHRPEQMAKCAKINHYHMEQFAYFLEKMRSTPDGNGTLLDNTVILYGSGISDSNDHLHTNLPILLAGGAAAQIKGGRHMKLGEDTPLANLHLTLLDRLGVPMQSLGDSTGELAHVSGV
ncbi:MAG TPA: DUF1552 domain-containing protein [Bryobacteraceae bacterium]|jgi:hypothetical protein|nr:DUF1552 domain-containing protein [Bryobacteraceae bacterium]